MVVFLMYILLQMASGLIVGGADRGVVSMYDAKKLIKGENALVFSQVPTRRTS